VKTHGDKWPTEKTRVRKPRAAKVEGIPTKEVTALHHATGVGVWGTVLKECPTRILLKVVEARCKETG
jgi:hypothetical protein